jgi:rfaE bifunctional protein kinase chain/domain/rfaE bifunctional protein nucleotidyltransferase chain/domain
MYRRNSGEGVLVIDPTVEAVHGKILPLERLADVAKELRRQGKRIVLCHGVFDLLHVGHIRHFAEAKAMGDILMVTVTEDKHVNKGPHRPAFPEALRCEVLAAISHVDFVAISRHASAEPVIVLLEPDVYVKGPDYKDASADVTGGIAREREAVERIGGSIAFTNNVTFSSSSLLNRHWRMFPEPVEEYLTDFRSRYQAADVAVFLDRLRQMRVVVVGEAIFDEYVYCDQLGKSAKEPVLAMRYDSAEVFAGGAMAVANHLAEFCAEVDLVTYLGASNSHEEMVRASLKPNVSLHFVHKAASPTILKRRYIESLLLYKLFEVYIINDEPIADDESARACEILQTVLPKADVVVAADFGHGLITPKLVEILSNGSRFLAVNTQVNAANIRFHAVSKYPRADYVCINEGELRLDARNRTAPVSELVAGLRRRMGCERFLVTRGRSGVMYFDGERWCESPSFALSVVDRVGAGDAVLALTSACVAAGFPAEMVAFVANVIGAEKVQIVGNRSSVERAATLKFIDALLK